MHKLKRFKVPLSILIIVLLLVCSFLLGSKYALDHLVIRRVTPNLVANAMKDDHFWVSYREDTLLISGTVMSVSNSGINTVVGLKTDSTYTLQCSFKNNAETFTIGQAIKVLAVANAAERLKTGVQLNNCVIP